MNAATSLQKEAFMRLPVLLSALVLSTPSLAVCNIVGGKAYGDCAGVTVNTGRQPFAIVSASKDISGISEGARVVSGGRLTVMGIADEVDVQEGGYLYVGGMARRVRNNGGRVEIDGSVDTLVATAGATSIRGTVGQVIGSGTVEKVRGSVIGGIGTE